MRLSTLSAARALLILSVLLLSLERSEPRISAQPAPDAQVVSLAQQVLAGGDPSLPALALVLAQSGIGVRGADGRISNSPGQPSQGLVFDDWELPLLLGAESAGSSASLDGTGSALGVALPDLDGAPFGDLLLADLQADAASSQPTLRFFARFIAALGQQAATPTDLLTAPGSSAVQLDAVQSALLFRRLNADLVAFSRQLAPAADLTRPASVYTAMPATAQAAPCSLTDAQGTILDAAAAGATYGFSKLLDYVKEHLPRAAEVVERQTAVLNAANLLAVYAKLVWTLSAFKADISMDSGTPLVRTKSALVNAERKTVRAVVHLDIGNGQLVNCLRPLLNAAGLDFSAFGDGAIHDAELDWTPLKGFTHGRVPEFELWNNDSVQLPVDAFRRTR